ncbi:helix-turn-helix domain-containing protein [Actinobaculum sp. 352]|uniref:helix-turn-helix domain-containing protein n=1 Tax=Actinobaculum sp. 352 TaxID=2490946 RepID=UPI0013DF3C50|nr:helix-turn-helix domain-containing protein [Actinobaculum sp. 352]
MITRKEAAKLLRVTVRTVDKLIATKQLPAYRVERQIRIRPYDVEKYLEAHKAVRE